MFNSRKLFFTADTHFGHKAIIELCNRPAENVDDMNEMLIERWNETVPKDGAVFHLGDVAFCSNAKTETFLKRLNGQIYLIEGNHDRKLSQAVRACFEWVKPYFELNLAMSHARQRIVLCHYALRTWNTAHYGAWNLHGHSHGSLPPLGKQLDVGVDTHYCRPYLLEEVTAIMTKRPPWQPDHHQPKTPFDKY